MMELIELKFTRISIILSVLMLFLFNSCQERVEQQGKLECILESIEIDTKGMNILVGQHNGWTDSTALIVIIFEEKSMEILNNSSLKGRYKENDIYFNQGNVDTLDTREYKQIPNNINWNDFKEEIDSDFIMPPYDPINIQIEYNVKRNCIGSIVRGEGYIIDNVISKCRCKDNRS